jgi:DnaJ-domain-containing protein 1
MRREQARREAEARAKREQAEQARQEQARRNEPPPRQATQDPRSPEEILGLKRPWTQDDLKTAYKREAGRTHPDKWIGKPEAIRQAMEEEYKAIQEAYRVLKDG